MQACSFKPSYMFNEPKQDYITNKCMYIWMHDLAHLTCYTSAPMASMHEYMNACSWHQNKEKTR